MTDSEGLEAASSQPMSTFPKKKLNSCMSLMKKDHFTDFCSAWQT